MDRRQRTGVFRCRSCAPPRATNFPSKVLNPTDVWNAAAGLDTHLGKTYLDGVELSGGQWQRVAIARGMMRATPLLRILDEPTAALDPVAEHALYERYSSTARALAHHGAITVLVSHRFSSVRMADRIIVLEHGRVTETGTHEQLVAIGGTWARMFDEQAAAYR